MITRCSSSGTKQWSIWKASSRHDDLIEQLNLINKPFHQHNNGLPPTPTFSKPTHPQRLGTSLSAAVIAFMNDKQAALERTPNKITTVYKLKEVFEELKFQSIEDCAS